MRPYNPLMLATEMNKQLVFLLPPPPFLLFLCQLAQINNGLE